MTDTSRPTVETLIARLDGRPAGTTIMREAAQVLGALLTERDEALRNYLRASRERDAARAEIARLLGEAEARRIMLAERAAEDEFTPYSVPVDPMDAEQCESCQ